MWQDGFILVVVLLMVRLAVHVAESLLAFASVLVRMGKCVATAQYGIAPR